MMKKRGISFIRTVSKTCCEDRRGGYDGFASSQMEEIPEKGRLYSVVCTETSHIAQLKVNIFSVTCAMIKVFNTTYGKTLELKKNATIMRFE